MTPEKILVQYGAPAVGEGNRLVLACLAKELAADYTLVDTSQTISSLPAQIWHRRMTNSDSSYNESMRNSPLSMALGHCLAIEGAIRRGNKKPRIGIFTQEMQLVPLAQNPQLLPHFYDHLFLLIPDAMPKHNSIGIMQKLSCHLTPVVWNRDAESVLKQYGLNPLLTAPFLNPLSKADVVASQTYQPRYSVIKGSGSGLPDSLRNLAHLLRNREIPNLEITTKHAIWKTPKNTTNIYSRGELTSVTRDIALASEVFTYPNEITPMLIQLICHGWLGLINIFEPRGQHEELNLKLLKQTGYPLRVLYKDQRVQQIMPQWSMKLAQGISINILGDMPAHTAITKEIKKVTSQ